MREMERAKTKYEKKKKKKIVAYCVGHMKNIDRKTTQTTGSQTDQNKNNNRMRQWYACNGIQAEL